MPPALRPVPIAPRRVPIAPRPPGAPAPPPARRSRWGPACPSGRRRPAGWGWWWSGRRPPRRWTCSPRPRTRAGGWPPTTWMTGPATCCAPTTARPCPTRAAPSSPRAWTAPPRWSTPPPGTGPCGPTPAGRGGSWWEASSTSSTWAPSLPPARSTASSSACPTWPSWGWTWSSSCPWRASPAELAGATTGWTCGPSTRPTAARRRWPAWWTPPTPTGSGCAWT